MSSYKFGALAAAAIGALALASSPAQAAYNAADTAHASFTSASSFLDFASYGITVDPNGQTTAQNNLLNGSLTRYTSNDETRYIFGATDNAETLVIDLGSVKKLASVGATWFDSAYQDRAPSSVTVSFSNTDGNFGSSVTDTTPVFGGASDLINLATPVSAQYVEYSFGGTGGVAIAQVFATAAPEPATWALMLIGVGAAGATVRSRRAASLAVG